MMIRRVLHSCGLALLAAFPAAAVAQAGGPPISTSDSSVAPGARLVVTGATGWARSSVNAAIFRASSLATRGDTQYIAFYDGDGRLVLGRRRLGQDAWQLRTTQYTGNVRDAHNAISIGVDGRGTLHVSWDLHGHKLRYARSRAPGLLELGPEEPMTGDREGRVTYPQFYALRGGDLLFAYREGSSGDGDIMLNRLDVGSGKWRALARPLIEGEGLRNAYINRLAIDSKGGWHLSWVWRESPDVASNHDVCYAFSPDAGQTWQRSDGSKYLLPITAAAAEVAWPVPQSSELINQTSMAVDGAGRPLIATYWREAGTEAPQFQLVWHDGAKWRRSQVARRAGSFRLSGGGTKRIPISRPLVVAKGRAVYVVFRDEERGSGVSVAVSEDAERAQWRVLDLLKSPLGAWEPTHDADLWERDGALHLLAQNVGQGDAETLQDVEPQPVGVLEWTP